MAGNCLCGIEAIRKKKCDGSLTWIDSSLAYVTKLNESQQNYFLTHHKM